MIEQDDLTAKQQDYAIFLPAISSFYAAYVGRQRSSVYVEQSRMPAAMPDMEQMNWLNPQRGLFPYRWSLYSAGHANLDLTKVDAKENMIRNRDANTIMLADSAHIQEKDADWLARHGREVAAPLYRVEDATRTLAQMAGIPYDRWFPVVEGVRVLDWAETASGVRVRTDQGDHEAASLVLTPGAWAPNIATALGVDLRPLRVPIAWLEPRDAAACAEPTMPVWYIDRPGECGIYGVPTAPDQGEPGGVKVAVHGNGTLVDPDAPKQPPTHAELESIRAHTEVFLPAAAGRVLAGAICLYTMSPDEHFVVDRMPGCRCVFVACGFSGHGFKFMPVMGRVLADLAIEGRTRLPIDFLAGGRFGRVS